jgi:hypothetical protein
MKKISFLIMSLLLSLCLFSCTNEEEEIRYSCNEDVNNWVKSNIDKIRVMSRSDWEQYDETVGVAIYRAFSQSQRINFWLEKVEELKNLNWSDEEIAHIQKIEGFINSNNQLFRGEELTNDEVEKIEEFFYVWSRDAQDKFGWTNKVITGILVSGNRMIDTSGNLASASTGKRQNPLINSTPPPTPTNGNCNCNQGSAFTCIDAGTCESGKCDSTSLGCGALLLFSCNGICWY